MIELLKDSLAGLGAGFLLYLILAAGRKLVHTLQARKDLDNMDQGDGEW